MKSSRRTYRDISYRCTVCGNEHEEDISTDEERAPASVKTICVPCENVTPHEIVEEVARV